MKKVVLAVVSAVALVGMLADLNPAMAQGRGDFRNRAALVLCDALVLDAEKSEKFVAVYGEVSGPVYEKMRDGSVDFQSMSREERREMFNKMQEEIFAGIKKELKGVLSEKEIESLDALKGIRMFMPVPELRGLRQVDLKDEQRKKLQPDALALSKAVVPRFPRGGDDAGREEAQKKFDELKAAFVKKVTGILDDKQEAVWKEKTKETQDENDEMMERIRNR